LLFDVIFGVIHGLNEDGEYITSEQREHLHHQSDRQYIRNKDREIKTQRQIDVGPQCTSPANTNLQHTSDYNTPMKHVRNLLLVDPNMIDELRQQMETKDCLESKAESSSCQLHTTTNDTNSSVRRLRRRAPKSECKQPQQRQRESKSVSQILKVPRWSRY